VPSTQPNLWVAPSRIALAKLESKLVGELDAHFRLKDRLEPSAGLSEHRHRLPADARLLTVNALVAATHLLIPIQSSYFALEGTDDLLETIEKVRAERIPTCVSSASSSRCTTSARRWRGTFARKSTRFRQQGLQDRDHQERSPGGEPGLQGIDLSVRARIDRRRRVLPLCEEVMDRA
jgi:hypothetical protein